MIIISLNDSDQEDANEIIRSDLSRKIRKIGDLKHSKIYEQEIILIFILDLFYDLNRLESPISLEKMVEKLSHTV